MDASEHYRQLLQLGREEFLASAAPAALVRYRKDGDELPSYTGVRTLTMDEDSTQDARGEYITEETMPFGKDLPQEAELEVYPLAKKSGASFPDRITIGRTLEQRCRDRGYVGVAAPRVHQARPATAGWWPTRARRTAACSAACASSRARSRLLPSRVELRIGDVDVTFYVAADLFAALGGTDDRRRVGLSRASVPTARASA